MVVSAIGQILIRADASTEIGTGHVMRCLALAQAWQDAGGKVIFVMAIKAPLLEAKFKSEGMETAYITAQLGSAEDARETVKLTRKFNANWVVVDGYNFGGEYQQIIKDDGLRLLIIDDYGHAEHYYADIVLNQNISADEGLYVNREPYTQLLLGVKYTLLRREFWQWCGWKRQTPTVARKILVTLGGSDAENVTLKVIQALQLVELDDLEAVVVVGGSNPHYEQLKSVCLDAKFPIHLKRNVTNMPELMAWADMAIAAGGSTNWELAFMGLPTIILVLADNQRAIAEKLGETKATVNLGWHENISATQIASMVAQLVINTDTRTEIVKSSQKLIDGEGCKQVLRYLEAKLLKLRSVSPEDCRLLWEWSNELEVRAASFFTGLIPWQEHVQWFKSKLNASDCIFYIAVDRNDAPVGQVRYDIKNNEEAVISISIDKRFRYQGYGNYLINLGCEQIFSDSNLFRINAYIKPNNKSSINTFTQADFKNIGTTTIQGHLAFHFVRNR
ncbi:UDP-2,4-diacetamido-2,4,6-trideoxy-beta-L-altropyranose hydrolase [Calothrix rhizosoleniae]|uniref:UDP-2,4-diacetamido-2,4, 6-trideoxy-beta-L-altropyranose hydrolase n=1 Tax=Calothrix rhizosoleniae TaxID=888997 RepID=UPI0013567188|nr:UDP-2,4-diacetamido-2,4,6-trideoxy-beta-L-altropyranose hydrolase [Calothrix rhizosoleniae]